jgi:hypothetical protein
MYLSEIIGDAVKYPFSNLKNFLILGIILVISDLYLNFLSGDVNVPVLILLFVVSFISEIVVYGYEIKILKSSLEGFANIPKLNNWWNMFIDGLKVFILGIVYAIPLFIILIIGVILIEFSAVSIGTNSLNNVNMLMYFGIIFLIILLYFIITIPFFLMSLANMAYNDSKIGAAFRFGETFNKIKNIGWGNFILWYIVTGIIYLVLMGIGILIQGLFDLFHLEIVGAVLYGLILLPYMCIFIFRSIALIYQSGIPGYLECDKCGGQYESETGESPDDYSDECECGGKLSYKK